MGSNARRIPQPLMFPLVFAPSPLVGEGWGEGAFALHLIERPYPGARVKQSASVVKGSFEWHAPPSPDPLPRGERGDKRPATIRENSGAGVRGITLHSSPFTLHNSESEYAF